MSDDPRSTSLETSDEQVELEMLEEATTRLKSYLKGQTKVELCNEEVNDVEVWALANLLKEPECSQVTSVVLRSNNLNDVAAEKLASMLEVNTTVTELDLGANNLTHSGVFPLLLALSNENDTLKSLSLEDNSDIEDRGIQYIAEIVENNTSLVSLNLSGLRLNKIDIFLGGLTKNETLRHLFLENVHMNEAAIEDFVIALCDEDSRCQLETLDLSYNVIENGNYDVFGNLFTHSKFASLKTLVLSFIKMFADQRNEFVRMLERKMRSNVTLEVLSLKANILGDNDTRQLSSILRSGNRLKTLDLSDNSIGIRGAQTMFASLQRNSQLCSLILEGNPFLAEGEGKSLESKINDTLKRNQRMNTTSKTSSALPSSVIRSKLKRGSLDDPSGTAKSDDGKDALPTKGRGKRRFAAKIRKAQRKHTPQSYNDNLDDEEETFVYSPEKKVRNFKKKHLVNVKPVKPRKVAKEDSSAGGSVNNNFNDDYTSVIFNESASTPTPVPKKKLRRFAKKKINIQKKEEIKAGSYNDNLDDDFVSCILETPVPRELDTAEAAGEYIFNDAKSFKSVVFEEDLCKDRQEEDRGSRADITRSFIITAVTHPEDSRILQKKDDDAEMEAFETGSGLDKTNWDAFEAQKCDLGFIERVKSVIEKPKQSPSEHKGVIALTTEEVSKLSKMLHEFENLLDREESIPPPEAEEDEKPKGRRRFAQKKGVIGLLKNRGKKIDYTLAKSIIEQKLISRQLVRNVVLIGIFEKLRRDIGSGVPTKIGGLLPSALFNKYVTAQDKETKTQFPPGIEMIENFSAGILLLKVIIWSVFKALAISDPQVDPSGRHLLAEFGKALLERELNEKPDYKEATPEQKEEKKRKVGRKILEGTLHELIDALVLLKPMIAYAELLLLTVRTSSPEPGLGFYEEKERRANKKADKNLVKKMKAVEKSRKLVSVKRRLEKARQKKKEGKGAASQRLVSEESVAKGKAKIGDLLDNIEMHKKLKKTKKLQKKASGGPSVMSMKQKENLFHVTKEVMLWRKNCPERIQNVLSDLHYEVESLHTILSIEAFLPFLFSFNVHSKIRKHYNDRVKAMKSKVESWFDGIKKDFGKEVVDHIQPELLPEVKNFISMEEEKATKSVPKQNMKPESELQAFFNKRNKNKAMKAAKEEKVKEKVKEKVPAKKQEKMITAEDAYLPIVLNKMFSRSPLSGGMIEMVQNSSKKVLADENKNERERTIKKLLKMCENGAKDTTAMKALKAAQALGVDC